MKKLIALSSLLILFAAVYLLSLRTVSTQDAIWKAMPKRSDAVKTLVVTGGHDHDSDFYSVFDDEAIRAVVDPHPAAFSGDIRKRFDVVVLYDMMKTMDEKRRKNLQAFVESGKGVVVLHHAIGD